jgi:ATP-dependent Lon protease
MNKKSIPVLYLFENVFYPDTIIPLSLTDESSQTLIKKAYLEDRTIALLTTHQNNQFIATAGKVIMLDEESYPNKITAIVSGNERIKLTKRLQEVPYPLYEYQLHEDHRSPFIFESDATGRLFKIFEKWMFRHVHNEKDRDVFLKEVNSPKKLINNIALFMIKDIELKILLLESTSLPERINILNAVLIGETPEFEDINMLQALKDFSRFEPEKLKSISN